MSNRHAITNSFKVTTSKEDPVKVVTGGIQGPPGISAYQEALNQGFVGTKEEWIDSLKGSSAYEIALNNGFVGTEQEWLDSLKVKIKEVAPDDEYKVFSNDGVDTGWYEMNTIINNNSINWDLGEF